MSTEPRPQTRRTGGSYEQSCIWIDFVRHTPVSAIAIARTSGLHITQPLIALFSSARSPCSHVEISLIHDARITLSCSNSVNATHATHASYATFATYGNYATNAIDVPHDTHAI